MQEVQIYLRVFGNYCAFHEMCFMVMYDVTNDKKVEGEETLEELENWGREERLKYNADIQLVDALLIDGEYYYSL